MSRAGQAERASGHGSGHPTARDRGSPSAWRHRLPVLALVLAGLAVASDLTLVQLGAVAAWDPLFGDGTRRVLFSGLARSLPVPDAGLGALAYAVEALLVVPGGTDRWTVAPRWPLALGLLTLAMAAGGIVLVLVQALAIGSFCTLCLASAAISWVAALTDLPELRAALGRLRNGGRPASSSRDRGPAPSAPNR